MGRRRGGLIRKRLMPSATAAVLWGFLCGCPKSPADLPGLPAIPGFRRAPWSGMADPPRWYVRW